MSDETMELQNKTAVVVGMGRSGLSAARFLHKRGARVILTDTARPETLDRQIRQLEGMDIELALGGHDAVAFTKADLIVLSPGVPHTIAPIAEAARRGVPVMGEVELAFRFIRTPIVAITGTNGKTTTTELTGKMLEASGKTVFVGGNIGRPLIDCVDGGDTADVVVAEISSFQTDTMMRFRPRVGVLLNVTQDHLDRYPDLQSYAESKARLFRHQESDDTAIFKADDPLVRGLFQEVKSRCLGFRAGTSDAEALAHAGALIHPDAIEFRLSDTVMGRIALNRTPLIGLHNRENIAAASLAALAAGGTLAGVQQALDAFKGLPHRLEPVGTIDGVRYINDSKGTNADAVMRALTCFDRPVVLIMGGRNKGTDFEPMKPLIKERVKALVVMGEAAQLMAATFDRLPPGGVHQAGGMARAVEIASRLAESGDTVLFSPACASFDMYANYVERGEDFRQKVLGMKKGCREKA